MTTKAKSKGAAVAAKPAKPVKMQFTIDVTVPAGTSPTRAGKLLKRLIDIGFEDCDRSPDDYDDKDKAVVKEMVVKNPRQVQPKKG